GPWQPIREVHVHPAMRAHDPSRLRLPHTDATDMYGAGRRAEPDLPAGVVHAGTPVEALPVQRVALVLPADLRDRRGADEIARLLTVADRDLRVVRPAVPPDPGGLLAAQ